jgi:hypothetical protein
MLHIKTNCTVWKDSFATRNEREYSEGHFLYCNTEISRGCSSCRACMENLSTWILHLDVK